MDSQGPPVVTFLPGKPQWGSAVAKNVQRRLAAILAADVVGYSRLMGKDEVGTLAALKAHRKELIEPKAAQYHGRTIKLMGDGALMEFPSVVDAVAFSVEVQVAMGERNAVVPEDRQIVYRIGINIGDIIVEDEDIYGDGVNVAARLEGLADPGGICVARSVYDQVKNKLDLGLEHLGAREVKNIAEPVTVYRVLLDDKAAELATPVVRPAATPMARRRPWWGAAAVIVPFALIAGVVSWWQLGSQDAEPDAVTANTPSGEASIAVLPFDNLSDDAKQGYFADGMTEDLITDLSKISGLFVIARNSSFSFKGQQVNVQHVAEQLGVRYVLEGSVRRADDQVRINAQLVDSATGGHIWADRFDGHMSDIFALQDKITANIVSALALTLTATEAERLAHRETKNPTAYDAYLQGLTHFREFTQENFAKAEAHLLRAIEIDPEYALAHAALAAVYWNSILRAWRRPLGWDDAHIRARRHLKLAMQDPTPLAHRIESRMLLHERKHDESLASIKRAVALDPNDADTMALFGHVLIFAEQPEDGVVAVHKAMLLDPYYPALYLQRLGYAYFTLERYEDAVDVFERARKRNPGLSAWMLFAAYGHLDQIGAAEKSLAEYLEYRGWSTWRQVKHILPYFPYRDPRDLERFARGMVKAGLCCPDQVTIKPTGLRDLKK